MEKTICIDGQDYKFKATAATPRVYRLAFGRDIYLDTTQLFEDMSSDKPLSVESLNAFENIAFCMNSQAEGRELKRESIEKDMNEWLDQFETFSIYKILPQLIELWKLNTEQTVKPKNQVARPNDQ
jgi:hypothetical protein